MRDFGIAIVVLGLGGAILYVLWQKNQAPPPVTTVTDRSLGQCGASYVGVGASVPCELVGQGIKAAYQYTSHLVQPVTNEVKTAASGIKTWEYVVTPVAISHATYNEAKHVLSSIF
jgi:hypothetical protein